MGNIFDDILNNFINKTVKRNVAPSNNTNNVAKPINSSSAYNAATPTYTAAKTIKPTYTPQTSPTYTPSVSTGNKNVTKTSSILTDLNKAVTGTLNYLQESNKGLNDIQQNHLDAASSAYIDANDVIQKINTDKSYYSTLFDNEGKPIDYSNEIIRLQETASNQFTNEDRKAAKQQLDLLKQYQADQKKMIYASQ